MDEIHVYICDEELDTQGTSECKPTHTDKYHGIKAYVCHTLLGNSLYSEN